MQRYWRIVVEKSEDTKGVIRSRKSKKERQLNYQCKRTNNDLQNTTRKAKDRPTRIPLKTGNEFMCTGMVDKQYLYH
jgi:hypothetical protein